MNSEKLKRTCLQLCTQSLARQLRIRAAELDVAMDVAEGLEIAKSASDNAAEFVTIIKHI